MIDEDAMPDHVTFFTIIMGCINHQRHEQALNIMIMAFKGSINQNLNQKKFFQIHFSQ